MWRENWSRGSTSSETLKGNGLEEHGDQGRRTYGRRRVGVCEGGVGPGVNNRNCKGMRAKESVVCHPQNNTQKEEDIGMTDRGSAPGGDNELGKNGEGSWKATNLDPKTRKGKY